MAGGEGNELRAATDADLGGQVGDVALHGLGRHVAGGQRCPWWSDLRPAVRSTSASRGVTPAAVKALGRSGADRRRRGTGRRPAGGGIGRRRPLPVGRRRRRTRALRPANASGFPTGREWPPRPPVGGHGGDTSRRGPARRRRRRRPARPPPCGHVDPTRRRGRGPPNPESASTRSDPKPPPRPPRPAHHRSRGHAGAPTTRGPGP